MTVTRISWVPEVGDPVDLGEHVAGMTFTMSSSPSAELELRPETERFLVIHNDLLKWDGPYTLKLRGHLYWHGYRLLFGRTSPRSRRVKAEYHRRSRSRGRRS